MTDNSESTDEQHDDDSTTFCWLDACSAFNQRVAAELDLQLDETGALILPPLLLRAEFDFDVRYEIAKEKVNQQLRDLAESHGAQSSDVPPAPGWITGSFRGPFNRPIDLREYLGEMSIWIRESPDTFQASVMCDFAWKRIDFVVSKLEKWRIPDRPILPREQPRSPQEMLAELGAILAWFDGLERKIATQSFANKEKKKSDWTKEMANKEARRIAKDDLEFARKPNVREWAKRIGCSTGLVNNLPFYQACAEKAGTSRQNHAPKPKAVGLTEKLASGIGGNDEELKRLMGEQAADREASSVDESDQPAPRSRNEV